MTNVFQSYTFTLRRLNLHGYCMRKMSFHCFLFVHFLLHQATHCGKASRPPSRPCHLPPEQRCSSFRASPCLRSTSLCQIHKENAIFLSSGERQWPAGSTWDTGDTDVASGGQWRRPAPQCPDTGTGTLASSPDISHQLIERQPKLSIFFNPVWLLI